MGGGTSTQTTKIPPELVPLFWNTSNRMMQLQSALPLRRGGWRDREYSPDGTIRWNPEIQSPTSANNPMLRASGLHRGFQRQDAPMNPGGQQLRIPISGVPSQYLWRPPDQGNPLQDAQPIGNMGAIPQGSGGQLRIPISGVPSQYLWRPESQSSSLQNAQPTNMGAIPRATGGQMAPPSGGGDLSGPGVSGGQQSGTGPGGPVVSETGPGSSQDGYWDLQKMQSARPLDMGVAHGTRGAAGASAIAAPMSGVASAQGGGAADYWTPERMRSAGYGNMGRAFNPIGPPGGAPLPPTIDGSYAQPPQPGAWSGGAWRPIGFGDALMAAWGNAQPMASMGAPGGLRRRPFEAAAMGATSLDDPYGDESSFYDTGADAEWQALDAAANIRPPRKHIRQDPEPEVDEDYHFLEFQPRRTAGWNPLYHHGASFIHRIAARPEPEDWGHAVMQRRAAEAGKTADLSKLFSSGAFAGAMDVWKRRALPGIQNELAAVGLADSNALSNTMAESSAAFFTPFIQQEIARRDAAKAAELGALADWSSYLERMGERETGRFDRSAGLGREWGDLVRDIEQSRYDAEREEGIRLYDLAREALFAPFGTFVPSAFGSIVRSRK